MLKRNENAYFDLLSYFEGKTAADGVFEDRRGRLKRRFTVEMTGRREGNVLVLEEHFLFDDGEREERVWWLTRGEGQSFTGRCADSVSDAKGHCAESAAYFRSDLRLKVGSRRVALTLDDAYYDMGGGEVMNRSTVSKWGIRLGQVLILFRKPDPQ